MWKRAGVLARVFLILFKCLLANAFIQEPPNYEGFSLRIEHYPFQLHNGDGYQPSSLLDLQQMIPDISHINSVSFLLWVEFSDERAAILEIVTDLHCTGNSSHLVTKLVNHSAANRFLSESGNFSINLESGYFLDQLLSSDEDDVRYTVSKSVFFNVIRAYTNTSSDLAPVDQTAVAPFDYSWIGNPIQFVYNLINLFEGLQNGDLESMSVVIVSLVGNVLGMVGDILKAFNSVQGLPIGYGAWGIGVFGSLLGVVLDIHSIATGNLSGLDLAIAIVSLIGNVLGLALGALSLAFPPLGVAAALVGLLFAGVGWIMKLFKPDANEIAKRITMDLNRRMPLTAGQQRRIIEALKKGENPPEDIAADIRQAESNQFLLGRQAQFLHDQTMFQRYVYPAIGGDGELYKDNRADLTIRKNVRIPQWASNFYVFHEVNGNPRFDSHYICFPNSSTPLFEIDGYECNNAFGIIEEDNRSNNITLFALGSGSDTAYGSLYYPNLFLVADGVKHFVGGHENDTFIVENTNCTGILDGGPGNDSLLLSPMMSNISTVHLNIAGQEIHFGLYRIVVRNIEIFLGRAQAAETFIPSCTTRFIEGNGGSPSGNFDLIDVGENPNCTFNGLFISVNESTTVRNRAKSGTFHYEIQAKFLNLSTRIDLLGGNATHLVILKDTNITRIINVTVQNDVQTIQSNVGITAIISNILMADSASEYFEPTIVLDDDVIIKVNKDRIVTTIFNINKPTELVRAPRFGQALFLINSTVINSVLGERGNDTYIIDGNSEWVTMDAREGIDTLVLRDTFWPTEVVHVDLEEDFVQVGTREFAIFNFEQVLGRKNFPEIITIGCGDTFIDGQGGNEYSNDQVTAIIKDCSRSSFIRVGNYTVLVNKADQGNFIYFLPWAKHVTLDFEYTPRSNHTFQLDFDIFSIADASVNGSNLILTSFSNNTISLPLSLENDIESSYIAKPTIVTNDSIVIRVNRNENKTVAFHSVSNAGDAFGTDVFENIFLLTSREIGRVQGGSLSDMFILFNSTQIDMIDGGDSDDKLVLNDSYEKNRTVVIDFSTGIYIDDGTQSRLATQFESLEQFIGRENASDHVICSCHLATVDTLGGAVDHIIIPNFSTCSYDQLLIVLRPNMTIVNEAKNGTVVFYVHPTLLDINEELVFFKNGTQELNQIVLLPMLSSGIKNVTFDEAKLTLTTVNNTKLSLNIILDGLASKLHPRILTQDFMEITVQNGNVSFLINVEGNETVSGFEMFRNVFFIREGSTNPNRSVFGSNAHDDTFVLANFTQVSGLLDGRNGSNVLILPYSLNGTVTLLPYRGTHNTNTQSYLNMGSIIGRNHSQDIITVDCNTNLIDSKGGDDKIIVPYNPDCVYNLQILITDETVIENSASNGSFHYILASSDNDTAESLDSRTTRLTGDMNFTIICFNCTNYYTQHTFVLPYKFLPNVHRVYHDNETCRVDIDLNDGSVESYRLDLRIITNETVCLYPKLHFYDGIIMDISRIGTYKLNYLERDNNTTPTQIIDKFKPVAMQFKSMVTVLTADHEFIWLGRHTSSFDMMQSSPRDFSYLVGNGGNNLYVITKDPTNDTMPARVIIYCGSSNEENATDLVEMSQLINPLRRDENDTFLYLPDLTIDTNDDLVVTVNHNETLLGTITLVNWRSSTKLGFLLGKGFMCLNITEDGEPMLVPLPYELDNQTLAVLDQSDFEDYSNFNVAHALTSNQTRTMLRNGTDMVITNALNASTVPTDLFTVVLKNYLDNDIGRINSNRRAGLTFQFSDEEMVNLDNIDEMNVADFKQVRKEVDELTEKEVFEYQCYSTGLFAHPRYCEKYYRCIKIPGMLKAEELNCPTDTIFCETGCFPPSDQCECDVSYHHLSRGI